MAMMIDLKRIYSIHTDPSSASHPFDLLASKAPQMEGGVYIREIEWYNYLFARKLLSSKEQVLALLDYQYHRPYCDPLLFLQNLKYATLEVPSELPDREKTSGKMLEATPVERMVRWWIADKEKIFHSYDAIESKQYNRHSITLAQRALALYYLQAVGKFPQTPQKSQLSRLIDFILGQNLKNLYDILRRIEAHKTAKNLQVVAFLFKKINLPQAWQQVKQDMDQLTIKSG